mgnify:CR=1 FL=1
MSDHTQKLIEKHNSLTADMFVLKFAVLALARQAPNPEKLLHDFSEMCEDTTVRAMYSGHPESFFQAFQDSASTFRELFAEL